MNDQGFQPAYGVFVGDGTYKTYWTATPDMFGCGPADRIRIVRWETMLYDCRNPAGALIDNVSWLGLTCSYDVDQSGTAVSFCVIPQGRYERKLSLPPGFGKLWPRTANENPAPSFSLSGVIPAGHWLTHFTVFTWVKEP